jgi:MFS transporter, PPP family, 3-phenylpropionic acid transporter
VSFFFLFVWFGVVIPHLQLLFAALGFSPGGIGLILGAFQLAGVAGPVVLGHAADRWGRYKPVLVSVVLVSSSALCFASRFESVVSVMVLAAVAGFFFRGAIPLTDALANATLPDPQADYGLSRVYGSISFIITNLILQATGIIDGGSATRILVTILGAGALYVLSIPLLPAAHGTPGKPRTSDLGRSSDAPETGSVPETSSAPETGDGPLGLSRPVVLFLLTIFLGRVGMSGYNSFFSIFLNQEVGVSVVGGYWALGAIAEIPVMFLSGRLISRFGSLRLVRFALFVMALRLGLWSFLRNPVALAGTQILHSITFGVFHVASIAFVTRHTRRERLGIALAAYSSIALGLPQVLGSVIGGFLIEGLGFSGLYAVFAALPLASGIILTREMARWRRENYYLE